MTRTFAQPLPTDPRQLLGWDEKQQKWIQNRDQTMSLIRTWNIEIGNGEKLHDVTKERDALKLELARLREKYQALHSQVGGYLDGDDWEHWQKYNAIRFEKCAERDGT